MTADYDDSVVVITDKNLASSDTKIFLPPAYVEDSAAYGQQVFSLFPTLSSSILEPPFVV